MMQPVNTEEEWFDLCEKHTDSPFVHTQEDWGSRLVNRDGILSRLSPEAIDEISSTIKFAKNGLAHMAYEKASKELGEEGKYELFELFGLGRDLARDKEDYECKSAGTCRKSLFRICTPNC